MINVENILKKLVEFNTIEDKENKKILDYIQDILSYIRIYSRKKRKIFNNE